MEKKLKDALSADKDILFAYLFGSQAAGTTHFLSDIDIACYLKTGDMNYYLKKDNQILGNLTTSLGTSKIDLVILNVAPLVLNFRIISESKVIISRTEQERIDFETAVLYRYFALKPFLDEYYDILRDKFKRAV